MHQLDETILKMYIRIYTVADPGFQVRGTHLKKFTERREAQKCVGYFDFTPLVYTNQGTIKYQIKKNNISKG